MATKKRKLKSKRAFLEGREHSNSYYNLTVSSNGHVTLNLADCYRSLEWSFGRPGDDRAKKKIQVLKNLIDSIHAHLHEE